MQRRSLRDSARRSRRAERRAGRTLIDVARSRAASREVSARTDANCGNDSPRQKPITRRQHASARRKTIPTQHARRHGADRTADRGHTRSVGRLRLDKRVRPFRLRLHIDRRRQRGRCRPTLRVCALEDERGYQPSCAKERRAQAAPKEHRKKTRKFFARHPYTLLDFRGHIEFGRYRGKAIRYLHGMLRFVTRTLAGDMASNMGGAIFRGGGAIPSSGAAAVG